MAPTFKIPGIYVEETAFRAKTIEGVATGNTVFIGQAMAGSFDGVRPVTSEYNFTQNFGALTPACELGYAVHLFFANGGNHLWVVRVPDSPIAEQWQHALDQLDGVELLNLLALPGVTDPAVLKFAYDYALKRRAFLLVDASLPLATAVDVLAFRRNLSAVVDKNAALYFPWVKVADSSSPTGLRLCAPSGALAGVIVRTDVARGVWKSPAGAEADVRGVTGLSVDVNKSSQEMLNPEAVNCLRTFAGKGLLVWGARTLATDAEWKYISVRRFSLYLEESLDRGLRWAVFEPNAAKLWSAVKQAVDNFLYGLFRAGALLGAKPEQAYFVRCDTTTMTADDILNGRCIVLVGYAPVKPAEFTIFKLSLKTARG